MKKFIISFAIGIFILTLNSCSTCCLPGKKPQGLITKTQGANLEHNYLQKKKQIASGSTAYNNDVRDFWFSAEKLQDYICYAKEEAKKQGKEVSGFRIYLGSLPLDSAVPMEEVVGFNTVFIVPTESTSKTMLRSTGDTKPDSNGQDDTNIDGINPMDYAGGGYPPHVFGKPTGGN